MARFVDCLVRLPNLNTLDILEVSSQGPISKVFKSIHVTLPSIRALRITHECHHLIENCPNLEDLTFATGLVSRESAYVRSYGALSAVRSHGERLKRLAGLDTSDPLEVRGELVNKSSSLINL